MTFWSTKFNVSNLFNNGRNHFKLVLSNYLEIWQSGEKGDIKFNEWGSPTNKCGEVNSDNLVRQFIESFLPTSNHWNHDSKLYVLQSNIVLYLPYSSLSTSFIAWKCPGRVIFQNGDELVTEIVRFNDIRLFLWRYFKV